MKINQHILAGIILSCLLAPASALAQCTTTNFEAAINVDAGTAPQDMAAGDFNSDGKTDLVITNFNNEVYILLGNTAGGPTASKLTSVNKARGVGVADFNKDGKPDLAINHENPDGSDAISILLGNGSGAFSAPVDFPTTNEGTLIVADFNNDTNPDVFSGSRSGGVSQLLLGNGTGGLSGAASKSVVLIENGVAADFNKDGKLDLVIANDGSFIAVYLGDGTGNFGPIKTFPLNRAKFLVTADFNGDNNLDVVTAGQIGGISILLGDGAGNFGAATTITLSFSPTMIVTADFNEDGKPDVAVDSGEGRIFFVLLGNGNGGFADAIGYRTNSSPRDIVVGDFNGDGNVDIASLASPGNAILVFGDGAGKLKVARDVLVGFSLFAIASGDLNNDGRDDLIVTNTTHHTVSVLINNGGAGFGPPTSFPVQTGPISIALGDLNGDQKLDVVVANFNGNSISVLLGDGQGGLGPANNIAVPGFGPTEVAIADLNTDGKPDLAVGYLNTNSISLLPGNGTGGFGSPTNFPIPAGTQDTATGDLNGDGLTDVAVATNTGIALLFGNAATGFAPTITIATTAANSSVVIEDFNGDGKADIAAAQQNPSLVNVYLGQGTTSFGPPTSFNASAPMAMEAADFNGDGNVDLVTTNSLGITSVLLANGAGGFADGVKYHASFITATRSLTTGDFNSDGRPDIAVTDFEGIASIILNTCSATRVALPTVSISNVSVTEGDSGNTNATFNVNLSTASTKTVVVSFYTAARDTTKDADYATRLGVVTFTPGVTSQIITVPVIGDGLEEPDEVFVVNLANALNAGIADAQGAGTIVNDDFLRMFIEESGPAANQAAALDATLFLRDPFRRTRLLVFAENLSNNGNVVISLKGADNQTYEIQAEDARAVPDQNFSQIVFALPETLAPGVCTVTIKAQGKVSNTTTIRIAP